MSEVILPPSWTKVRLKELARSRMGKTILKSDLTETGLPVYSAGASTAPWGYLEGCDISYGANTLVISARGNIGMPKRPRQVPFICTQTTIACSAYFPETVDWLFWFLSQLDYSTKSSQTTIPMLRTSDVDSFEIPLPPLAEQKRIVAKIEELVSELEAGEESLRAARRQLGIYRQSLLKQAFDGKLTETWRSDNPDKLESPTQLLARIQAAREARYERQLNEWNKRGGKGRKPTKPKERNNDIIQLNVDNNMPGLLPEGWCWCLFRAVCDFANGDRGKNYPNRSEYVPEGIPWINTGHIEPDGSLSSDRMHFITREKFESLNGGQIEPGDLVYCLRGATFGKTAYVRPYREGAIASSLMIVRPILTESCSYIFHYLLSPLGKSQLQRFDNGSAQPNLSAENVGLYLFPLCSLPEQQEIVRLLDAQFEAIERNEREIDAALKRSEALRQAILKKAFTGQLVPQDPADEPASGLLARLQAVDAASRSPSKRRRASAA